MSVKNNGVTYEEALKLVISMDQRKNCNYHAEN